MPDSDRAQPRDPALSLAIRVGADSDPGRLVCVLLALTEEPRPSGQLTVRARSVVGWAYRWLVPERCGRDPLSTVRTLQALIGP